MQSLDENQIKEIAGELEQIVDGTNTDDSKSVSSNSSLNTLPEDFWGPKKNPESWFTEKFLTPAGENF